MSTDEDESTLSYKEEEEEEGPPPCEYCDFPKDCEYCEDDNTYLCRGCSSFWETCMVTRQIVKVSWFRERAGNAFSACNVCWRPEHDTKAAYPRGSGPAKGLLPLVHQMAGTPAGED